MVSYSLGLLPLQYHRFPDKNFLMYCVSGPPTSITNYLYYIEGADHNIILDPCSPIQDMKKPPGFEFTEVQSFEEALGKIGLEPADVDIVILTHLHADHFLNVFKCINADIYIQEKELEFAKSPHPLWAGLYDIESTEKLERMKLKLIKGDKEIIEGIKLLLTPGHSPGCQSVLVETAKGSAVVGGFCCIRESYYPPEPLRAFMEVIPPGIHTDAVQAYDSIVRVKNLAKIVVPLIDSGNPERIP